MKKTFYVAIVGGFFMLLGVFFACKEGVNPSATILTAEILAADSDFKNFAILSNERKKGLAFLNPTHTKAERKKTIADFNKLTTSVSTNSDEKLLLVQMMGYATMKDYLDKIKEISKFALKVNEKYPQLKTMDKAGLHQLLKEVLVLLKDQLPYRVYPNKFGLASVYNIDDLIRDKNNSKLRTQEDEDACCRAMMTNFQQCTNDADVSRLTERITSHADCAKVLTDSGPDYYVTCIEVADQNTEIHYGENLKDCSDQGAEMSKVFCGSDCGF